MELPSVGMGCLYVIDTHGDEGEAGGIDQDVDYSTQVGVCRPESEKHLHEILQCQAYHGD